MIIHVHPGGYNLSFFVAGRQRISTASQTKVTKMLLIVSTIFVLLNSPSYYFRIMAYLVVSQSMCMLARKWILPFPFTKQPDHEKNYSQPTMIAQYITQQLFLTNFGINFLLYCMSGQNFRYIKFEFFNEPVPIHRPTTNIRWWTEVINKLIRIILDVSHSSVYRFRKELLQWFRSSRQYEGGQQATPGTAMGTGSSDKYKKKTLPRNVSWDDAYELRSTTIPIQKWAKIRNAISHVSCHVPFSFSIKKCFVMQQYFEKWRQRQQQSYCAQRFFLNKS